MRAWFNRLKYGSDLPVIAGMATMPTRAETFGRALTSVLPQVDKLYLFLDKFEQIPALADDAKIIVVRSQDVGDLKANGKLYGLSQIQNMPAYYLCVDDDILYPPNFVRQLRRCLVRHNNRGVVGAHGCILHLEVNSYCTDRDGYNRCKRLKRDKEMHVLGTDGVLFRSDALWFDVTKWQRTNMVDLLFAIECEQRGLKRISIKRRKRWIKQLATDQADSIYVQLQKNDQHQTRLANQLLKMISISQTKAPAS